MIQNILFATDMGLHTPYLLHHVSSLACRHQARLVVVHAIEPPGHMGDAVVQAFFGDDARRKGGVGHIDGIIAGVKNRIIDLLEDEYIDGQSGLAKIRDVQVVAGKPADVILDQASARSADLIILGSHGQDTDSVNVLGSVTTRVLQLSRVPVYMVPLVRNISLQARAG